MGARLIGFGTIGLVLIIVMLAATYMVLNRSLPKPKRELDVRARPSLWWADSRAVNRGAATEISIVRVDNKTAEILERRVLKVLGNDLADYAAALDQAQDQAYEAARKANLGLMRR